MSYLIISSSLNPNSKSQILAGELLKNLQTKTADDACASAKNLIELTGKAWENKIVAFLCAAGGQSSYMSIMSIANSLMLDFRCIIVPRFVYAIPKDFKDSQVIDQDLKSRITQLSNEAIFFHDRLG